MIERSQAAIRQPYCCVAIAPPNTHILHVLEYCKVNISMLIDLCNAKRILALYPEGLGTRLGHDVV